MGSSFALVRLEIMNRSVGLLALLAIPLVATILSAQVVGAVPMVNDPKGFHDIAWGMALAARQDLEVTRSSPHITEYRLKTEVPAFAGTPVTSVALVAVDDQFARVTIRYQGEQVHKQVLAYLEKEFGPIERIPGQMTRGLNQQYNWRGPETEINLTYQASTERGFIFIDSRTLAPRFNDQLTDSAE
jgi:hypothetical protein